MKSFHALRQIGAIHATGFWLFSTLLSVEAGATPSTTFWAPSTASCQPWAVPHITYDTYFAKGPAPGQPSSPVYPVDTGLTLGVLPGTLGPLQAEAGFDLLYPSQDPVLLNAKLCIPESALLNSAPALSFGIYNLGFAKAVTDYDILHLAIQKSFPIGGYIALGVYHGMNQALLFSSTGGSAQTGALVGLMSPSIEFELKGLKKIAFAADIQSGHNVIGAWGAGTYIYFSDAVSLLTGPVFFIEPGLQPGGRELLWTMQLDIDVVLDKKETPKLDSLPLYLL